MINYESIILSLLNLRKSDIKDITISDQKINVVLTNSLKKCPYCTATHHNSDGYFEKHVQISTDALNSYDVSVYVQRLQCCKCHRTFSDTKHMAPANHRISYKTIISLLELLKSPAMSFTEAARIVGISQTSAIRLFDKHVHIPASPLPEVLCVDEVYTKNTDFKGGIYSFVLYDFDRQKLVDVHPSRKKYSLYSYFEKISEKERNNVRFICMDMYFPYKMVAQKYLKKAVICVDNFHILKHINDDLNRIRIRVMNSFDTSSKEYYLLKHFNYLLFNQSIDFDNEPVFNRRMNRYLNRRDILNLILSISPDLYTGYQLKERYYSFSRNMEDNDRAVTLDVIKADMIKADIKEFSEFITLLTNWRNEILNSFCMYNNKRINNSVAESLNAKISTLLFITKGIRNHERRRKRILYSVNQDYFTIF